MMRPLCVAAAAAGLSACAQPAPAPMTEADILARGDYLVNSVVLCGDCHTPMLEEGGHDESRKLHGAPVMVPPPLADYAPALAGGPANYSEEQFLHFLQTGERPDGTQPRPPMPPYRLNEDDARAVAAYIRSLPPPQE